MAQKWFQRPPPLSKHLSSSFEALESQLSGLEQFEKAHRRKMQEIGISRGHQDEAIVQQRRREDEKATELIKIRAYEDRIRAQTRVKENHDFGHVMHLIEDQRQFLLKAYSTMKRRRFSLDEPSKRPRLDPVVQDNSPVNQTPFTFSHTGGPRSQHLITGANVPASYLMHAQVSPVITYSPTFPPPANAVPGSSHSGADIPYSFDSHQQHLQAITYFPTNPQPSNAIISFPNSGEITAPLTPFVAIQPKPPISIHTDYQTGSPFSTSSRFFSTVPPTSNRPAAAGVCTPVTPPIGFIEASDGSDSGSPQVTKARGSRKNTTRTGPRKMAKRASLTVNDQRDDNSNTPTSPRMAQRGSNTAMESLTSDLKQHSVRSPLVSPTGQSMRGDEPSKSSSSHDFQKPTSNHPSTNPMQGTDCTQKHDVVEVQPKSHTGAKVSAGTRRLSLEFLKTLYDLVNDCDTDDLIWWNSEGDTFIIFNYEEFDIRFIKSFKLKSFKEFEDQLSKFGFKRHQETEEIHYRHVLFQKYKINLWQCVEDAANGVQEVESDDHELSPHKDKSQLTKQAT